MAAAKAAAQGASVSECKKIAEDAQKTSGVYFVVDTLEFLHRGGRIGGGRRFLGSALNIKPILTVGDGKVEAAGSVRTKAKAVNHLIELVHEQCKGKNNVHLATLACQCGGGSQRTSKDCWPGIECGRICSFGSKPCDWHAYRSRDSGTGLSPQHVNQIGIFHQSTGRLCLPVFFL